MLKKVTLPYDNKYIYQDKTGHSCTTETEFLVDYLISSYKGEKASGSTAAKNDSQYGMQNNIRKASEEIQHSDGHIEKSEQRKHARFKVLEVGTGSGIISIMLALAFDMWEITAVDIQIPLYRLAVENKKLTGVKVDFRLADIRNYRSYFREKYFDLLIANPPYYKAGSGKLSHNTTKNISRFDLLLNVDDLFKAINYTLKPDGIAYLLLKSIRLKEMTVKAKIHRLRIIDCIPVNRCHALPSNEANDPFRINDVGENSPFFATGGITLCLLVPY